MPRIVKDFKEQKEELPQIGIQYIKRGVSMNTVIYYFSGAGNSLSIALSLAQKLPDTKVESIMSLYRNAAIPASCEQVGFVYPCYYGHPPKAVTEAVRNIRLSKQQRIFCVVTFGGFFGQSLIDMKRLLERRTANDIQGFSVRMPGSHILGYPAFPEFLQRFLLRKAEKKIGKIAAYIQNSTPTRFKNATVLEKLLRSFTGESDDKLPNFGQMGTLFYAAGTCNQCGVCSKLCPVNNIRVCSDQIKWGNNCCQCMACIQWCPQKAVAYPSIPIDRPHYHHPAIGLDQMLAYQKPEGIRGDF